MSGRLSLFFLCAVLLQILSCRLSADDFHVSPRGKPGSQGTAIDPWDLATALAAVDRVHAGDTVWLHGGTYRGGFVSNLAGKPDSPVMICGVPHERVTVDTRPRDERDNGLFTVLGTDSVYRDFEVMCSDPLRQSEFPGPWPTDIRRGNVYVRADRVSLINLIIHDLDSGVGFWEGGEGGEISGCLIYNNGWKGPDRGHGHGIYAQNQTGTKRLVDNVIFHQFGYGIHVYGSRKASLKGFDISGNILFENGCLSGNGERAAGIMVGGESPAERIAVHDNVVVGGGIRLGYPWGPTNEDVSCTNNYSDAGLVVRDFRKASIVKNTIIAASTVVSLEGAKNLLVGGHRWAENEYYVTDGRWGECSVVENGKSRGLTYLEWQKQTGMDAQSRFTRGSPGELRILTRPNRYQAGRAHLAILNPKSLPEVEVDLSQILTIGQAFRIVSVKDFFGKPVTSGVYRGKPVYVPMAPPIVPRPVGMAEFALPVTEPLFAAFVVLPALEKASH